MRSARGGAKEAAEPDEAALLSKHRKLVVIKKEYAALAVPRECNLTVAIEDAVQ